jgi:hypothetical protein
MGLNSCANVLSKCSVGAWICLISIVCCLIIPCIVFGSILASNYVNNRNTRQLYTSTTCLLLNYSIFEHQCQQCGFHMCSYYKCFDENFTVSYPISNNTYIRSVFTSINRKKQHLQTQV